MLSGKTIVVGVSGGIACYKVVDLVSKLKKQHADVHVIMTKHACEFVSPLTFRSICHNPVITEMFEEPKLWDIQHISLAEKADLFVLAPATANLIGKVACGIADDMLTTTITATKSPVIFIPAMNTNMYGNKIVQENMNKLKKSGYIFMEPDTGLMACGTSGKGRLPDTSEICNFINSYLFKKKDLKGKNILITAGPTREALDPVRFLSNNSSGKMGYAIAAAARNRGAEVTLISGPVNIEKPHGIKIININSTVELLEAAQTIHNKSDISIFAAAPADYRPLEYNVQKIKKDGGTLTVEFVKNPDVAYELGKIKSPEQIHIGFCAETENLIENGLEKLKKKNFDFIVANDVTQTGAGFNVDTNIVKLIFGKNKIIELPIMSKAEVAEKILDEVLNLLR